MIVESILNQHPYLLASILDHLDARSLAIASQVNHLWEKTATDNKRWKSLSKAQWPDLCKKFNAPSRWKSFYNKLKTFKAGDLQHQRTLQWDSWWNKHNHHRPIRCLAILPDGTLVSGATGGAIRLWNTQTGECLNETRRWYGMYVLNNPVLAIMHDGALASSCGQAILLWSMSTGNPTDSHGHRSDSDVISALAGLPNGTIASACGRVIQICNMKKIKCLNTLKGHTGAILALTILPNGTLVSGSKDSTIRLWDTLNGKCSNILRGHTDTVLTLTVLSDGTLVSGSSDTTIRFWDAQVGECLTIFKKHGDAILALASLPDGTLASGSKDGIIRLWDTLNGKCLNTLGGHMGAISALAVLPDGTLASGSEDSTIRIWEAKPKCDSEPCNFL